MTAAIVVAEQFSRSPAGRNLEDGPFSGERFREEFLVPALNQNDARFEVDLRGALTLGSSFLDEAFGGLVRVHRFAPRELKRRMDIHADLDMYVSKVWGYVDEAGRKERVS
jgi:hypothetical protein